MAIIETDLRNTIESAKRIRFDPVVPGGATNVQDAIVAGGGSAVIPTAVNIGSSPYVPLPSDQLLLVDTSGGAIVINLAASISRAGLALVIKDSTGNADANPITVNRNGAETIDGATSILLDSKFVAMKFAPKTAGYAIV